LKPKFAIQTRSMRGTILAIGLCTCLMAAKPKFMSAGTIGPTYGPPLTAAQVVSRMVETNRLRREVLRGYTSLRNYHLELRGLIHLRANMEVKMTYRSGVKDFTILSQSGSAYVRNHVFKRLLEAESQASQQDEKRQVAITPENYNFELAGYERDGDGHNYILKVTPKVKRKFLFQGFIWVNDQNFSIVRIEGQPAKTLSWWTPKVNFVYRYKRVGDFWLPELNETVTDVRVFGRSILTIQYKDYNVTDALDVKSIIPLKPVSSERVPMVLIPPSPPRE
jgi:hypothetical protein